MTNRLKPASKLLMLLVGTNEHCVEPGISLRNLQLGQLHQRISCLSIISVFVFGLSGDGSQLRNPVVAALYPEHPTGTHP